MITGGAGYIGSNCAKILSKLADIVIVDDFTTGHYDAIEGFKYHKVDIRDSKALDKVFKEEKVDAVIHFAAKSLVGESCADPYKYFSNNVYGTLELLKCMIDNNVKKIVFSSSAAVYGNTKDDVITEETPKNPTSPYGETKLMMEEMMKWFDEAYGLKYVSLRYFNVCGASDDSSVGEDHHPETHLIPIIIQVLEGKRDHIDIFGSDYNTKDGTNIRDYVNVVDLVDAHIKALNYLMNGGESNIFNLGTNTGSSNLEIIRTVEKVSGKSINYKLVGRRPGDPDSLVASCAKAERVLGYKNNHTLEDSLRTAIKFHETHKDGYKK